MINDLYKNIIDSFNTTPTLEPKKQVENKEIKKLEKFVRIILNPKSNKSVKKKAIEIIKNKIQNIGETHHLRIDRLIHLGRIDTEELNFALEIICDTKKSKNLFAQIDEYKEKRFRLLSIKSDIVSKQKIQTEINDLIEQIKLIKKNSHSINPIKRIKSKRQLDDIKNKIFHIISRITSDDQEKNVLKEILSKKPFNAEEFKNIANEFIDEQIRTLQDEHREITLQQYKNRSTIPIKQDKFSRIISLQKNDHLAIISQENFRKSSEKKNEFISKIIFILKLIDLVEKNDVTALNELEQLMQQKIKLENANKVTEEKKVERKR